MSIKESLDVFIHLTLNLEKIFEEKIIFSESSISALSFAALKIKIVQEIEACQTDRKKAKEGLLNLVADTLNDTPESKACLLGAIFFLQISIEEEFDFSKKLRSLSDSFKDIAYSSFSSSISSLKHSLTPSRSVREEETIKSRLYQSLQMIMPRSFLSMYTQLHALLAFEKAMLRPMPNGKKRIQEYDFFGEKRLSEEEKTLFEKKFFENLKAVIQSTRERCVHFSAIYFLQSIAQKINENIDKIIKKSIDEGSKKDFFEGYFKVLYGAYLLIIHECKFDLKYISRTKILSKEFKCILESLLGELIEDTSSLEIKIEAVEVFLKPFIASLPASWAGGRSYFGLPIYLTGKIEQLLRFYKEKEKSHPSLSVLKQEFVHIDIEESKKEKALPSLSALKQEFEHIDESHKTLGVFSLP